MRIALHIATDTPLADSARSFNSVIAIDHGDEQVSRAIIPSFEVAEHLSGQWTTDDAGESRDIRTISESVLRECIATVRFWSRDVSAAEIIRKREKGKAFARLLFGSQLPFVVDFAETPTMSLCKLRNPTREIPSISLGGSLSECKKE